MTQDTELLDMLLDDLKKMPGDAPRGPAQPVSEHYYLMKHMKTGRCVVVDHTNIGYPPKVPEGWTIKWDSGLRPPVENMFKQLCQPNSGRC
jgi:hypothetical protein